LHHKASNPAGTPGYATPARPYPLKVRKTGLVADGRVDAAAIDSQVLAVELRDHPQLAGSLRVVGAFGPSTIQPVVAASLWGA
jgi:hypothetical protein